MSYKDIIKEINDKRDKEIEQFKKKYREDNKTVVEAEFISDINIKGDFLKVTFKGVDCYSCSPNLFYYASGKGLYEDVKIKFIFQKGFIFKDTKEVIEKYKYLSVQDIESSYNHYTDVHNGLDGVMYDKLCSGYKLKDHEILEGELITEPIVKHHILPKEKVDKMYEEIDKINEKYDNLVDCVRKDYLPKCVYEEIYKEVN